MRPICINYGCNKPVAHDGKRWRPHCSHCQKASWGGHPHALGVTPFKQGRCSNEDSHLGFPCYINWDQVVNTGGRIKTHIDHKDGNPLNNVLKNCEEVCGVCHDEKSRRSGDFDGWRNYRVA